MRQVVFGIIGLLVAGVILGIDLWLKANLCTQHDAANFSAGAFLFEFFAPGVIVFIAILAIVSIALGIAELVRR